VTEDKGWRVIRHRSGARRMLVILGAVCAVGLLTAGAIAVRGRDSGSTRTASAAASPSPSPVVVPPATLVEPSPAESLPPPDRIRIASIGVDAPLEQLGLNGSGALQVPADFQHAGWYTGGAAPGEVGPAVIAGHVDTVNGPAVFFRLRDLKAGDVVEVSRGGTWLAFRVVGSQRFPKAQFPAADVYRPTPVPELRLITCGGDFDHSRRSYYDNIVVYAVAA
jgi:hypothetical protein